MKYHKFTQSGFKDIGIGRLEIVAKKNFNQGDSLGRRRLLKT